MPPLKIAMLLPPWIDLPPEGYGGLELTIDALVRELHDQGHHVEVIATGQSTTGGSRLHAWYDAGQYEHIARPLYEVAPIAATQVLFGLERVARTGDFDVIHDHNGFFGPLAACWADSLSLPPMLHTLHGPFTTDAEVADGVVDNRDLYRMLAGTGRVWFAGISHAQLAGAPPQLAPQVAGVAYNAVDVESVPFDAGHDGYYLTLARFARDKGQALAARICAERGLQLKMAGVVNGMASMQEVATELGDPDSPHHGNADVAYFRDEVLPLLEPGHISFVGNVSGDAKQQLVSRAKALLFPIDWEEPFGMAVVEAMACGTPVVAMRRGALPELVQHGVNGFLADTPEEFAEYVERVDELDPEACRRGVREQFGADRVAQRYVDMYRRIIASSAVEADLHHADRPVSAAMAQVALDAAAMRGGASLAGAGAIALSPEA